MRKILLLLVCAGALLFVGCVHAGSIIRVYEQAIEDVSKCSSNMELKQLDERVNEQLDDLANRPGSDRKMSSEDTQRIYDVQQRYYRRVEARARELSMD